MHLGCVGRIVSEPDKVSVSVYFIASNNLFRISSDEHLYFQWLMYDNDVIIWTVFVRLDLPEADNTYCCDYSYLVSPPSLMRISSAAQRSHLSSFGPIKNGYEAKGDVWECGLKVIKNLRESEGSLVIFHLIKNRGKNMVTENLIYREKFWKYGPVQIISELPNAMAPG